MAMLTFLVIGTHQIWNRWLDRLGLISKWIWKSQRFSINMRWCFKSLF